MSRPRRSRIAGFALAAGLLGAACAGGSDTAADPAPAVNDAPAEQTAPPTDAPAVAEETSRGVPDAFAFSGSLVGGGELDAATLADKPTAFWFWSPT